MTAAFGRPEIQTNCVCPVLTNLEWSELKLRGETSPQILGGAILSLLLGLPTLLFPGERLGCQSCRPYLVFLRVPLKAGARQRQAAPGSKNETHPAKTRVSQHTNCSRGPIVYVGSRSAPGAGGKLNLWRVGSMGGRWFLCLAGKNKGPPKPFLGSP